MVETHVHIIQRQVLRNSDYDSKAHCTLCVLVRHDANLRLLNPVDAGGDHTIHQPAMLRDRLVAAVALTVLAIVTVFLSTSTRKTSAPEPQYYGQDKEDQYAYETFFSGQRSGTYLELGAHDGRHLSNTLFFSERGWKGVLIEPDTQLYPSLTLNRPDDVCLHKAICANSTQVHFAEQGLTSGIYEFMSPEFIAQWHPTVKIEDLPVVHCAPLSAVLAREGMHHINFFSLDVENAELQVLMTLDFSLVRFDVIVVEADGTSAEKDEAVKQLLMNHGYQYHGHIVRNDWFVHSSFVNSSLKE